MNFLKLEIYKFLNNNFIYLKLQTCLTNENIYQLIHQDEIPDEGPGEPDDCDFQHNPAQNVKQEQPFVKRDDLIIPNENHKNDE